MNNLTDADFNDVYFIDFDIDIEPGKLQAVRVRIDLVTLEGEDLKRKLDLGLCDHPLYKELKRYVKSNP